MGLHGLSRGAIPDGQYIPLTRALIKNIRAGAPNAKLIWASSTPVSVIDKPTELDAAVNAIVLDHNAMAAKIMNEERIPVDDLYALSVAHLDLMQGDGFHWKAEGFAVQGEQVAKYILKCGW